MVVVPGEAAGGGGNGFFIKPLTQTILTLIAASLTDYFNSMFLLF